VGRLWLAYLVHKFAKFLARGTGENGQLQRRVFENGKQTRHVASNVRQKLAPLRKARKHRQRNKIRRCVPTLNQQHNHIHTDHRPTALQFGNSTYKQSCILPGIRRMYHNAKTWSNDRKLSTETEQSLINWITENAMSLNE